LGRIVRIILTFAPICYSLALFTLHRKTRNRETAHSAVIFSSLAALQALYCLVAAFGDGAVLFYTGLKWGEMDVAKHLAVSQVFVQQFLLCVMIGMWVRGRNVVQTRGRSLCMEEMLALVAIPTILGALAVRASAHFITVLRNDQCFTAYEVIERSVVIHFASASGLFVASLIGVLYQAWLWRSEWKVYKKRDEQCHSGEHDNWTSSPAEKSTDVTSIP
jgi:hypothetical protein